MWWSVIKLRCHFLFASRNKVTVCCILSVLFLWEDSERRLQLHRGARSWDSCTFFSFWVTLIITPIFPACYWFSIRLQFVSVLNIAEVILESLWLNRTFILWSLWPRYLSDLNLTFHHETGGGKRKGRKYKYLGMLQICVITPTDVGRRGKSHIKVPHKTLRTFI
jgi:hypothetical protein